MPRATPRMPGCFSLIFFLLGLVLTAVFGYFMIWLPLRANLFFTETTCVVLDKRLAEQDGEDGKTYRPEIHIEYVVNGVPQRTWTYDAAGVFTNEHAAHVRTLGQFQVGQRYPCWFDPGKPDRAVLTRRFSWWGLMVLIPVAFMVFGAIGLMSKRPPEPNPQSPGLSAGEKRLAWWMFGVFFGGFLVAAAVSASLMFAFAGVGKPFWLFALMFFGPFLVYVGLLVLIGVKFLGRIRRAMPSPEKAAVRMLDALPVDDSPTGAESSGWPTVPPLDPIPTPGRWLRYRLVSNTSPGCTLGILLGVALFWNGIVSVFLVQMIEGHRVGQPNWILTVFLIPFVLIGMVLIGVVLAAGLQLVTSLLVGAVRVEIADHSMRPGRTYEFVVEQSGRFRLGRVSLVLACTESATYTQGTDTRTETNDVSKEEVAQAEAMPREGLRGKLTVPKGAMHSFASDHNKITWTLRFKGRVGILPYESEYPVLVVPASEGGPA